MPICKVCGRQFVILNTQQRRQRTTCGYKCATAARIEAGKNSGYGRGEDQLTDEEMRWRMYVVRHNTAIQEKTIRGDLIPMDW